MTKKWDVIIIGGGLSGLVAANYLAHKGLAILMLEKGKEVGGRARTHLIEQQYFNLGPHALYKKGKVISILKELNILLHGNSPKLGGVLIKETQEFRAPFTLSGILTTKLFNLKERIEWMKVLVRLISTDPQKLTNQPQPPMPI